jgi:hypothetical protein
MQTAVDEVVGTCVVPLFGGGLCGATAYENEPVRNGPVCPRHSAPAGKIPKPEFTYKAERVGQKVLVEVYEGWTDGRRTLAGVLSFGVVEWKLFQAQLRAGDESHRTVHGPRIRFEGDAA